LRREIACLGIDLDHIETFAAQRGGATRAGIQANFAFSGQPAQQHGHSLICGVAHIERSALSATPTRLISHSNVTPDFSFTRARTSSPRPSISAAVASPRLMRKLQ